MNKQRLEHNNARIDTVIEVFVMKCLKWESLDQSILQGI